MLYRKETKRRGDIFRGDPSSAEKKTSSAQKGTSLLRGKRIRIHRRKGSKKGGTPKIKADILRLREKVVFPG